jgi:predicted esterase
MSAIQGLDKGFGAGLGFVAETAGGSWVEWGDSGSFDFADRDEAAIYFAQDVRELCRMELRS